MHLYGTQAISEEGHVTIGQVDTIELAKHMAHRCLFMIQL